ncbi:hypothetical protein FOJ82_14775 [Tessaracoccus rhinocerotis]|uniref:DUF4333 domain-containing protein n=1 Tax=Tessaracoccus rhinocerotis TaxID=1689449 RepID=A0A553JXB7_9ACTN|nr:hypothetical protein [Tessaracoccus rhinocerotis]TRY17107.1 hypothetical protein FOJ82_14775 [Tessaracoccus rhinocerotis]
MTQHPQGPGNGPGTQPDGRPDFPQSGAPQQPGPQFRPAPEPPTTPSRQSGPQFQEAPRHRPGPPPGQGPQFQAAPQGQGPQFQQGQEYQPQHYGQQPYPQRPGAPAPGRRNRTWLTVGIIVVVVALLAGGWALFGRDLLAGEEPTDEVTESTEGEVPQGDLPENPVIDAPEVIDEVAEAAGLTCHDEASTGVQIKGCYLHDPGHLVTLRFRINEDAEIDKLSLTLLHNDTTPEQRSQELVALVDPILPTLPISDADREAFLAAITGTETNVDGETEWREDLTGRFSYRFGADTSSLDIGNSSTDFMAAIPLSDDPAGVIAGLEELDWLCEDEDATFTCEGPGRGTIMGAVSTAGQDEPKLTGFTVWFDGQEPLADEPRMLDAYAVLAASGDKGEALAVGLRMLCEGEKQFFNSDAQFYRGDAYYEVKGVQFN